MNDVVALARELIRLPTITGAIEPTHESAIEAILARLGYETELARSEDGTPHWLATRGSGARHVALVGHYDVVPPGTGWSHDPFAAEIEGGFLWGRGACDMKSGLAALLIAGAELSREMRVSVFIAGDEETASHGVPLLLDASSSPIDVSITGEPTARERSGDAIKIGRRAVVQGRVTILGTSGHAAYASATRNLVHELDAILGAIRMPLDAGNEHFPPSTLSVTHVRAGDGTYNVIPADLEIRFDARLSPETPIETFRERLHARLDALGLEWSCEYIKNSPSFYTRDREIVDRVVRGVQSVTGVPPQVNCLGGTSDARFFAARGVPSVEIGVPAGNMHGADEFVRVEEIPRLVEILLAVGMSLGTDRD